MTAFRLLKVGPEAQKETINRISQPLLKRLSPPPTTVRDRLVPELQRSPAEEVQPLTVLRARGEDLLCFHAFILKTPTVFNSHFGTRQKCD